MNVNRTKDPPWGMCNVGDYRWGNNDYSKATVTEVTSRTEKGNSILSEKVKTSKDKWYVSRWQSCHGATWAQVKWRKTLQWLTLCINLASYHTQTIGSTQVQMLVGRLFFEYINIYKSRLSQVKCFNWKSKVSRDTGSCPINSSLGLQHVSQFSFPIPLRQKPIP